MPSLVGSVIGQLLPNSFVGLLRKQSLNRRGSAFLAEERQGTSAGLCALGKARSTEP